MWDSRPPPCALGSTEPVRRKSCTHRLTLASPTLKRRPMSLNDSSPTSYSDTTRQRRSTDTGLGMTFTSPKSDHDSHSSINSRDRRCSLAEITLAQHLHLGSYRHGHPVWPILLQ